MPDARTDRNAAPESEIAETTGGLDRRTLLRGVAVTGALGASAGLLAGCGGGSGGEGSSAGSSGSGSAAAGNELGSTSQIPVGGGKIFGDQQVVVTQPAKGDFEAFSAVCTHQGCTVNQVSGGKIICPCHGSEFSIQDGSVVHGPAQQPLPAKNLTVKGGNIELA
jgi:nitrite reductase/ring-hydroxylating ferredoxin subunit